MKFQISIYKTGEDSVPVGMATTTVELAAAMAWGIMQSFPEGDNRAVIVTVPGGRKACGFAVGCLVARAWGTRNVTLRQFTEECRSAIKKNAEREREAKRLRKIRDAWLDARGGQQGAVGKLILGDWTARGDAMWKCVDQPLKSAFFKNDFAACDARIRELEVGISGEAIAA